MPEFQKKALAPELKETPFQHYFFTDEHKVGWQQFWESINGDINKCKEFAKKGKIEDPDQWCASLYKFLFSVWPGDPSLLTKEAAIKNFQSYVKSIAEAHIKNPHERYFYASKGVTKDDFVRILMNASEYENENDILKYVNARIPSYGEKLLEEYMLQFGGLLDVTAFVDRLRKTANNIREEVRKSKLNYELKFDDI